MKPIKTSIGKVAVSTDSPPEFSGNVVFAVERSPLFDAELSDSITNPALARTAAICYFCPAEACFVVADHDAEDAMLEQFWDCYRCAKAFGWKLIGVGLFGDDLAFLIRRSWTLGVRVPHDAMMADTGPHRSNTIIDLTAVWLCGMSNDPVSLYTMAESLGLRTVRPDKPYHILRSGSQAAGFEYFVDTITLIQACAVAMGLMAKDELPNQRA